MYCVIGVLEIMISIQNVYKILSLDYEVFVLKLTNMTKPKFDLSLGIECCTGVQHTTPYKTDRHKRPLVWQRFFLAA